jgi:hypothetical protein
MCRLVDMANFSSTPMLRNNSGAVRDPQQIKMYPGVPTDIGAADFVQNNLGNNLPQVITTLQFIGAELSANLGMANDDPGIPDQANASISPTQALRQSYREFSILKDEVSHFYWQMDGVYENMASIVLRSVPGWPGHEYAKKWKERCIANGVPEQIFDRRGAEVGLPDHIGIKASRVAGDGSTVGLMLGLQQVAATVGTDLSPRARKSFKSDMILAALGPDAIERYTDGDSEVDEVAAGASLAGVENGLMQMGKAPVFSPSNEHQAHVAVHMALNVQIMQAVQQQQMDPIEANKTFELSVPHTEQHLQAVAQSEFGASFVEKWKPAFDQVKQYFILNRKNAIKMYQAKIREQQKLEEEQQAMLSEDAIKREAMERDQARKDAESKNKADRQDRESETRADLKRRDVEQKADNDRLKIQLDASVKGQKNAADASLEANRAALKQLTEVELPTE